MDLINIDIQDHIFELRFDPGGGGGGGGVAIQGSGTSVQDAGTVYFSNSNSISFGLNNSTMTARFSQSTHSHATYAEITHTHGSIYTEGIVGSVITNSSDSSGLTLGMPAWITTAAMGASWELEGANTAGTTSSSFERVYFSGGNNITLSGNDNTIVFSVGAVPGQTIQTENIVYINGSTGSISFATASSLSSSVNGSTISFGLASDISSAWSGQTTANQSRVVQINGSSGNISFNAGTFLSLSANASGLTYYVTDTSAITSAAFPSANTTKFAGTGTTITGGTMTLDSVGLALNIPQGSLYFNDGSGISWGSSVDGTSTTITGSVVTSALTGSLMPLAYSSGFQTSTLASTFVQTANSSLFQHISATSVVTSAAFPSADTTKFAGPGFTTTATAGTALVGTLNSSGLLVGVPAYITTYAAGGGSINFSVTGGSADLDAVMFGSGSGLIWGLAGSTITGSLDTTYIAGTFMDKSYSSGFQTATLAGTFMDKSYSSGFQTATLSGTFFQTASSSLLAGVSHSHGNPSLSLVDISGATASASNGLTLSLTGYPAGTLSFINSNGVSFGSSSDGSTTSVSASVETAYIPLANSTKFESASSLSNFFHPDYGFVPIGAYGQGSISIKHMYVPFPVTASAFRIGGSLSGVTLNSSGASSANSANMSLYVAVYTRNSQSLSRASYTSANNAFTWANSGSSTANTSIDGLRQLTAALGINMSQGEYWVAVAISKATTLADALFTIYGADTDAGGIIDAPTLALIGVGTVASRPVILYQGIHTATTNATLPTVISKAYINWTSAGNVRIANFWNEFYNITY